MDYKNFVNGQRTLIVAPAGYGKTHTIAECLKHTQGKQLVLTHTHAGVASLKEKAKKEAIRSNGYHIETISSFSQRYVQAFYTHGNIPDQDSKNYHSFIAQKAKIIFQSKIIRTVLKHTYEGLFVDEYQDCTKDQHQLIISLADILPVHILGDPLQGIFDFNNDAVVFETDLADFEVFPELPTPYRWHREGNNRKLGDNIKNMRQALINKEPLTLLADNDNGFHVISVNPDDLRNVESNYRKGLNQLINNPNNNPDYESLLLVVPEYNEIKNGVPFPKGGIVDRVQIRAQIDFSKSLVLLEAIDDKSFYSLSKKADRIIEGIVRSPKPVKKIKKDILEALFNKTGLKEWFNDDALIRKNDETKRNKSSKVKAKLDIFLSSPSPENLLDIILEIKNGLKLKYSREEVFFSFLKCLKQSQVEMISVYDAMKKNRNTIRRVGRKVHGKCIGTTRLTKGLEFDTVAILDAHKFDCPKHLYVALSRSCKKLIIFTENNILSPYKY